MFRRKISVCIATYNGEKFIEQQLETIINQTVPPDEIIISDDNSTDRTLELVREIKTNIPIRIFINKERLGFVYNFEKAIQYATGDFIALADQDDMWAENKLELLMQSIGEHALIHSDAALIDETGNIVYHSFSSYYKKTIDQPLHLYFNGRNNVTGCTCLFKACLRSKMLPFPPDLPYHDWWLAIAAYRNGGIAYTNEPLVKYRQHNFNYVGADNKEPAVSKSDANKRMFLYKKALLEKQHVMNLTIEDKDHLYQSYTKSLLQRYNLTRLMRFNHLISWIYRKIRS